MVSYKLNEDIAFILNKNSEDYSFCIAADFGDAHLAMILILEYIELNINENNDIEKDVAILLKLYKHKKYNKIITRIPDEELF